MRESSPYIKYFMINLITITDTNNAAPAKERVEIPFPVSG